MLKIITSLVFVGAAICLAEISQGPSYHCVHPSKKELSIFFVGKNGNGVEVSGKENNKVDWKLNGYRAFLDEPRKQIEIHFAPSPLGFLEVREQFMRKEDRELLELTLLEGDQLVRGWKCRYLGAEVNTVLVENPTTVGRGDSLWVRRAVKGMGMEKRLTADSLATLSRLVKRYCIWGSAEWKRVFQPMNYLSLEAISQVNDSLSSDSEKKCFKEILDQIAFDKFPPLQRWVFWANLASQGNQEALRIAIREFMRSPLAREKDVVLFFQSEIRPTLKRLSKLEIDRLASQGLNEKEKKFLEALWKSK